MSPDISSGIERAWETLSGLAPSDAERNSSCTHDPSTGHYLMRVLGMDFSFDPRARSINPLDARGAALLEKERFFFEHVVLWYLACAKSIAPTGRHLKPENLRGGHHFFKGAHELPLKELAAKYGTASGRDAFIARAEALGGSRAGFGDASAVLVPLPGIPLALILWLGDDEFPARADLLFDSSADYVVPLDVLWSSAMLTLRAML